MIKSKIPFLFILVILSFIAISIPVFKLDMWLGHDVSAHYQRALSVNAELSNYQIPPTFDFFNNGKLGYAWNLFYPPLTSILFSLINIISLNSIRVLLQLKISAVIISIIAILSSYYMGVYFYNRKDAGCISSILFITSSYFLNNYYIRFSIGELLSHALIPLMIVGIYASIKNEKQKILLPISSSLILLSNIPSVIVCIIACALIYLFEIKKVLNRNFILFAFYSVIFIVMSTSFYTIPLIYEQKTDDIWAFSNINNTFYRMWELAPSLSDLLTGDDSLYSDPSNHVRSHRTYGIPLTILFFVGISLVYKKEYLKSAIASAIILTLMASKFFPWYAINDTFNIITFIQFPWRILMFSSTIFVLISTYTMLYILDKKSYGLFISIILTSIIYTSYITNVALNKNVNENSPILSRIYKDYLPKDGNIDIIESKKKTQNQESNLFEISFKNGYPIYSIKEKTNELELPVIKNNLIDIYINGEKTSDSADGYFIKVSSSDNIMTIELRPSIILYIGYAISIISIVSSIFFIYIIWRRKN